MLKQGLRLKESEMNERNAGAGPCRVKGTCSRIHPTVSRLLEKRGPLGDVQLKHITHHPWDVMENIICRLTYFALQRNVSLKFLGVLLKGL